MFGCECLSGVGWCTFVGLVCLGVFYVFACFACDILCDVVWCVYLFVCLSVCVLICLCGVLMIYGVLLYGLCFVLVCMCARGA